MLNKFDLLHEDEREARAQAIIDCAELGKGRCSAFPDQQRRHRQAGCKTAYRWLTEQQRLEHEDEEAQAREQEMRRRMRKSPCPAPKRGWVRRVSPDDEDDDDFDDDDYDVDVEYAP